MRTDFPQPLLALAANKQTRRRIAHHPHGFTLLELSIVLVIVGLLAGGILAGQELLRSYEIRSIITQKNEIVSALGAFRQRYESLPGDFNSATTVWGEADANPATCLLTISLNELTCDGDGSGQVGETGVEYEIYLVWKHLYNAGLSKKNYIGIAIPIGAAEMMPLRNVPEAKIGGGWVVQYSMVRDTPIFDYRTTIKLGNVGSGGDGVYAPLVTPEELYAMDIKYDDGRPLTGSLMAQVATVTEPGTEECMRKADLSGPPTHNEEDAIYQLTYEETACALHFVNEAF